VLIGPKGTRPRWPHVLIVVEAVSGLVVGSEFLAALDGLPAMWSEIPGKLLSILSKSSARPARIRVRSTLYRDILRPLLNALKVGITTQSDLPALEEARESLFEFLTRQ
jgi:predicted nucleotidyltransferase